MGAADRARARLVDGLRDGVLRNSAACGGLLSSAALEEAFRAVPRHLFLPGVPLARAYADEAVAVQAVDGVTTSSASQPSMMAIMLAQLDLHPGHRVLEIGAGTGYNAALMARLVGPQGRVVAVDIDADLVEGAGRHLAAAGVSGVELVCADGALGHPPGAPYDRIVLTVGSGVVRLEWIRQLAPGGRLLLPLGLRGTQLSVALDLGDDGLLRSASIHRCAFVRLRGVGATAEAGTVVDGVAVLPADGPVRPDGVRAALNAPGTTRYLPEPLGPADLWDGFGMWLALRDRAACRLTARPVDPDDPDPDGLAAELLPLRGQAASIGILDDSVDAPGLAVVVLDPAADLRSRGPWPVRVRAFGGPPGDAAADRLRTAMAAWVEAGRPLPADLRLTVVPVGIDTPVPDGAIVLEQEHCRVLVHLPAP